MPKKYTILINSQTVIEKLDSLPQRSKGAYITQAIEEKISRNMDLILNEEKIVSLVRREVEKLINKNIS